MLKNLRKGWIKRLSSVLSLAEDPQSNESPKVFSRRPRGFLFTPCGLDYTRMNFSRSKDKITYGVVRGDSACTVVDADGELDHAVKVGVPIKPRLAAGIFNPQ